MIIPAVFLPIIAFFIIAAVFYTIKKAVELSEKWAPKEEDDIKFEQRLPEQLFEEYEKKREQYDAGLITKKEVVDLLMKRALHDYDSMVKLQTEGKSLRQAEIMGKLPPALRDGFVAARKQLDNEINYVKAEAEDLQPGLGAKIMEIVGAQVKENNQKQQEAATKALDQNVEKFKEHLAKTPGSPKMTEEQMKRQVAAQMQQQMQQRMMVQRFIEQLKAQGASKEQIVAELAKRNINVKFDDAPQTKKNI